MRIVFFGSDKFSVPSLEAVRAAGHELLCVVTQPDKKSGRGLNVSGTEIKSAALNSGLKLYQPLKVNSKESTDCLKSLNADIFVVIAYGQILSREVLNLPKLFCLNIHASVLPKYRGAAPINWAIINGGTETGVTAIKMNEKMDQGEIICHKQEMILAEDNSQTLGIKLSKTAACLLTETLDKINRGDYILTAQDEAAVSFAPKLKKEDGLIDWNASAKSIHDLVRGCYEWPGAYAFFNGKLLKIFKTSVFLPLEKEDGSNAPGTVIKVLKDYFIVSTGSGDLVIEELQIEGKRRMFTSEFLSGHKISVGECLLAKK